MHLPVSTNNAPRGLLAGLLVVHLAALRLGAQDVDCRRPSFTLRWHNAFGAALAPVGDIDGDGVEDHAGGAPGGSDPGSAVEGVVHVISGRTASPLYSFSASSAAEGFGRSLAALRGRPGAPALLAVGSPCSDGGRGRVEAFALSPSKAELLFLVKGVDPGELLGASLAAVPSGNGAFAIGAPGSNAGGPRRGRVILVDAVGSMRGETSGLVDFAGYGAAVSSGLDLNGDGDADVLIGSQDSRAAGDTAGHVTVRSHTGELLARIDGKPGERLGSALTPIADLDGDSFHDILAGAPGVPQPPPCSDTGLDTCGEPGPPKSLPPGAVYVLRGGARAAGMGGTLGAILRKLADDEPGARFGAAIAAAGDIDRDGAGEVAVGAPFSSRDGAACNGRVDILRGADGSVLWSWSGGMPDDRLGFTLALVGDQNGDQALDLLVSRRRLEGEVNLYSLGDRDGNNVRDACQPCAAPENLAVGDDSRFSLTRVARRRCFRIDPEPGTPLRISLESAPADSSARMMLRWGKPPESDAFDHARSESQAEVPGILIPSALAQPAYVVVEGRRLAGGAGSFRLSVTEVTGVILHDITPSQASGGAGARIKATVRGLAMPPGVSFELRPAGGGAAIPTSAVTRMSAERVDLVVDLGAARAGAYDLVASVDGGASTILAGAFNVIPSAGHEIGRVSVLGPALYRNNTIGRLTVRVENKGSNPLEPALFQVTGPAGTTFGFSRGRQTFLDSVLGLARSRATPDGSIPPGGKVDVTVWFRRLYLPEECPPDASCAVRFEVRLFDPRADAPIDWGRIAPPAGLSVAEWQRALPAMSALGSRWSDYHRALLDLAERRAQRGQVSASALPPFDLGLRRALDLPVAAITGFVRDQSGGTPVAGVAVVAVLDGRTAAFARTNAAGYFVLDQLEKSATYRLEVADPATGRVGASSSPAVRMPIAGDVYRVEIVAEPSPTGEVLAIACPACEAAPDPAAPLVPPPETLRLRAVFETLLVSSFDPNEKNGSGTQGGDSEIDPAEAIEYRVDFENTQRGESGAASRHVGVTDTLRPELDWTTVELLEVAVESRPQPIFVTFSGDDGGEQQDISGGSGLPVDPSELTFQSDLPYGVARWSGPIEYQFGHPEKLADIELRIVAAVEPSSEAFLGEDEPGVITWTLEQTNRLVPGPGEPEEEFRKKGFLAFDCPEDGTDAAGAPCGGHVSFSILPRQDLTEGTVVTNDAEIIFDLNAPERTEPPVELTIQSRRPGVPAEPNPPSGDANPPVGGADVALAWQSEYADTFDVYLWHLAEGETRPADPQRAIVWRQDVPIAGFPTSAPLLSLPPGAEYRWQVVARDDGGQTATGPVWGFATAAVAGAFRRGDVDGNARLEITDAVRTLDYLFSGGAPPGCLDAGDADDSGLLNITDPILVLTYLFLGGAEITAPGPEHCGSDPGVDDLDCHAYSTCG